MLAIAKPYIRDFKLQTMEKFERNRSRVKECPCGKSNSDGKFVPFIGKTDEGYCHSCCRTIKNDNGLPIVKVNPVVRDIKILELPFDEIRKSKSTDEPNYFAAFIFNRFGRSVLESVVNDYSIGTSALWNGSTIFWYIDAKLKLRTGKIMQYDLQSGKRIKEPKSYVSWVHSGMKIQSGESFKPCLYGEHLTLQCVNKPVALVESEKTAIIGSIYFPNFVWLATGGKGSLSYEKLKPLLNKKIVLYPDLDAYDDWRKNASHLSQWFNISVSEYLYENSTSDEKNQKLDIADYLLRFELSDFKTL